MSEYENNEAMDTSIRWLQRARDGSNYFIFFRNFGRFLSKSEALFLQDLMNRHGMANQKIRDLAKLKKFKRIPKIMDEEGFFRCSTAYLSSVKYLEWTTDEQKRIIPVLVKKGLIQTKLKGMPATRWIRIDYRKVEEALDQVEKDEEETLKWLRQKHT